MKTTGYGFILGLILVSIFVVDVACEKNTASSTDSSGSMTEAAVSTVGGAVNSTTSGGAVGIASESLGSRTRCPTVTGVATLGCSASANVITLDLGTGGCSYASSLMSWVGETLLTMVPGTYSAACGSGDFPALGAVGSSSVATSFTRTFGGILGTNTTAETNGAQTYTVALDTSNASSSTFVNANGTNPTTGVAGFSYNLPNGDGGFTRAFVSSSPLTHSLSIGVRLVEYSGVTASGTALFDHTLSTWDSSGSPHALTVLVTGGSDNVHTVSGNMYLQHNLMQMTATAVFTSVVHTIGGSSPCCFPTSGTVKTTFSGGVNSGLSETMTFSSATCTAATLGQVGFTDINGNVGTKTLVHCL